MPATKTLIEKIVLTEDAASVTFSSIPGTYDDLVLICSARTDSGSDADPFGIKFNGSTSNYTSRRLQGDGSSATSSTGSNTTAAAVNGGTSTASTFGSIEAYIPNYAGSTNKSFSVTSVTEDNSAAALIRAYAMLWSDTSAITSIELTSGNGGDFVTGSSFYLYGIQASPNTPILTQGTQTVNSTEVIISNYDSNLTYSVTASAGTASRSGDTITVSGLSAGQTITVTVSATDSNGYVSASASGSFATSPVATGGTITESGGYRIHTFTSSGTFVLNDPSKNLEYLVVAGGGGLGRGGAGGGGALSATSLSLPAGNHSITIGGGGDGSAYGSGGTPGTSTSIGSFISSTGGGGGGDGDSSPPNNGGPGGSGGGGGGYRFPGGTQIFGSGGSGIPGQGFPGGSAQGNPPPTTGVRIGNGGGGGATSAGSAGDGTNGRGGAGGNGISSSISGTAVVYAGGSGGYGNASPAGYAADGSGAGPSANRGGGGSALQPGPDAGGSGIVIIRYAI